MCKHSSKLSRVILLEFSGINTGVTVSVCRMGLYVDHRQQHARNVGMRGQRLLQSQARGRATGFVPADEEDRFIGESCQKKAVGNREKWCRVQQYQIVLPPELLQ